LRSVFGRFFVGVAGAELLVGEKAGLSRELFLAQQCVALRADMAHGSPVGPLRPDRFPFCNRPTGIP
jgi:hypothetical protein